RPEHGDAELRINGRPMQQASADAIRSGQTGDFSHSDAQVVFTLPADIANGPPTTATFSYSVQPRIRISVLLAALIALVVFFICLPPLKPHLIRASGPAAAFVLQAPYLISTALCWIGLVACAAYAASSISAWWAGWALPTTALLRWSTAGEWAAGNEPYFAYPL